MSSTVPFDAGNSGESRACIPNLGGRLAPSNRLLLFDGRPFGGLTIW
jgi:hypothetical protein